VGELEELYYSDICSEDEGEGGEGGKGKAAGGKGKAHHGAASHEQLVSKLKHELASPGQDEPAVETKPADTGELV
jgi:hypothetical protein